MNKRTAALIAVVVCVCVALIVTFKPQQAQAESTLVNHAAQRATVASALKSIESAPVYTRAANMLDDALALANETIAAQIASQQAYEDTTCWGWEDCTYYDWYGYDYTETYQAPTYASDFQSQGVVYQDGITYTWYSQNVLPGYGLTELNNNGRHVNESGFVCDADGYIAVASSDYAQGEVVSTPYGDGKVYDSGCESGVIDIYTDF